mmetsp:Transcript_17243/g.23954  ORF Transcript_17243/g.23954 Transcript_17243/m.23954 type:complete len:509 (-) Transcript_17243:27-1553(-)
MITGTTTENSDLHHVVIVGAGAAGLVAAREILHAEKRTANIKVTIVEASDYIGGRIRADLSFVPGHVVDTGAEFIHGQDTTLTKLVDGYSPSYRHQLEGGRLFEEIFVTAQGDGGPSEFPTPDGKIGMYYLRNKLLDYNDEQLSQLHDVLEEMHLTEYDDPNSSVGEYLLTRINEPELIDLAIAGYGNTAACTNLDKISLSAVAAFERYWEENEVEGDFRISSRIGMHGIITSLLEEIDEDERVSIKLNWMVSQLNQAPDGNVKVVSSLGDILHANSVIVTAPPTVLTDMQFQPALPSEKLEALNHIGMENAVKFCLKFNAPFWPDYLQSMVCADCPIPELWFREFLPSHFPAYDGVFEEKKDIKPEGVSFLVVCFFTSELAEKFLRDIHVNNNPVEEANNIALAQFSKIFEIPRATLEEHHVGSRLYDWSKNATVKGGYMFPKRGLTRQHLKDLAKPYGNVLFAGEATNTNACCTVQAAMDTGVRAASEVHALMHRTNKATIATIKY